MRPLPRSRRQGGFTLLEIIIVFVLIAGLLAFLVPKIYDQMGTAQAREAKIRLQTLVGNIELYKLEVGRYPDNLQALVKQPSGVDKWNGPYAKDADLKDSWGNDYRYTAPGSAGKPYDLVSLGADGREGGDGPNRDISN
ncbi:MAG TPA: type II secretion system major pseudopilin GspG [Usitatibacter sp.]|nr:type II secretion system major pseudopilin GspG [Usitatibacter sp.]